MVHQLLIKIVIVKYFITYLIIIVECYDYSGASNLVIPLNGLNPSNDGGRTRGVIFLRDEGVIMTYKKDIRVSQFFLILIKMFFKIYF